MKLYIKNMVCNRCKMAVEEVLLQSGLHPASIALGEVEIEGTLDPSQLALLDQQLLSLGFERIDDKKCRLVEKVKTLITQLVHVNDNDLKMKLSDYIASALGQDYSHVSSMFSRHENTTIEQYYMLHKIERIKELIVYDELNLNEIADRLNYSSASHLSKQFKKVTGLSPTHFKKVKEQKRKPLDRL